MGSNPSGGSNQCSIIPKYVLINRILLCYNAGMKTKEKGDLAMGHAINHFISAGYEVCLPIGDKKSWDMVVEKDQQLMKVQVKYAGIYGRDNKCKAGLRITGGNKSSNNSKKYSDKEFDFLFIYTERGERYCVPWSRVSARNEITIEDRKYMAFKVYD